MARTACICAIIVAASGCESKPCRYYRDVELDASATPFESGASAFSPCERCPPYDGLDSEWEGTAATRCHLFFYLEYPPIGICRYGPDGGIMSSANPSEDISDDIPNAFNYCERECPDEPYFDFCSINAYPQGADTLRCGYGGRCGED